MSTLVTTYPTMDYEGKRLCDLLPFLVPSSSDHYIRATVKMIHSHLTAGNRIYVKFNKGAREGSIGYLDLDPVDFSSFGLVYSERPGEYLRYRLKNNLLKIKFDDSSSELKVEISNSMPAALRGLTVYGSVPDNKTAYIFRRESKAEKPATVRKPIYDQFGIELKEGQTIITNYGSKNDFHTALATIERITDLGTIFIKTIPTLNRPKSGTFRHGIYANNCMVVDDTFMDRILLAKLSK